MAGSTGNGFQFASRSSLRPWNRPQSTSTLPPGRSSSDLLPVTVRAAPTNSSTGTRVVVIDRLRSTGASGSLAVSAWARPGLAGKRQRSRCRIAARPLSHRRVRAYGRAVTPGTSVLRGLTSSEAAARLRQDGPNALPTAAGTPAWRQLVGQFVHFFAGAAVGRRPARDRRRAPRARDRDLRGGAAERRVRVLPGASGRACSGASPRPVPRRVTVVRDGAPMEIDAADMVVGDVVLVQPGDRVERRPAGGRGARPAARRVDPHRRERARRRSSRTA